MEAMRVALPPRLACATGWQTTGPWAPVPAARSSTSWRQHPKAARPPRVQLTAQTGKLTPVLIISCINLMGFTVVTPITPGLMDHFKLASAASIGFMSSAFALGRFCTTSIWPIASDFFGRKRVVFIALIGGALGSAVQGLAISLHWSFAVFLLARGLSGMFSGIVPVMKAYISDSFEPDEIPKILAYREAAGTLAFVIGPFVGGFLASKLFALPLFFSSATGVIAALLAMHALQDSQPSSKESAAKGAVPKPSAGSKRASLRTLAPLLLLSFTWACTRTCFHAYYPLLVLNRYHFSVTQMGALLTSVSLLVACLQVGAFDAVRRRLGLRGALGLGGTLVGAGLLGLGAGAPLAAFLASSAAYAVGVALITPVMPALLLQAAPRERRGTFLGFESVVVNFGRIVAPPLFGLLLHKGALPVAAITTVLSTGLVWWHSGKHGWAK